jgi:hypothetical protein
MYGVLPTSQPVIEVPETPSKLGFWIIAGVTIVIFIVLIIVTLVSFTKKTLMFTPYNRDPSTTLNMYQPYGYITDLTPKQINNRKILVCASLDRLRNRSGNDQSNNYAKAAYVDLKCEDFPMANWQD